MRNGMIHTILWDIDGTLLDFQAAERSAIRECFRLHDMGECTDEMLARYIVINHKYWESLERGEISKRDVLIGRFREFFRTEGLAQEKAEAFNEDYQYQLGETCICMDHSYQLIEKLKAAGLHQYVVTNGTKKAQDHKLENSGLGKLMDGIYISEEVGYEKPMQGFFDAVFRNPDIDQNATVLIGDSLTSDIQGANNAHIPCIWYNPHHAECEKDLRIDYEVDDLWKIVEILFPAGLPTDQ